MYHFNNNFVYYYNLGFSEKVFEKCISVIESTNTDKSLVKTVSQESINLSLSSHKSATKGIMIIDKS